MITIWKKFSYRSQSGHQTASWLSISLDAALGCRTNVFQIIRSGGKKSGSSSSGQTTHFVTIHPQAAPLVCRHCLDTLISLAKVFPSHFLPETQKDSEPKQMSSSQTSAKDESGQSVVKGRDTDFWEVLLKLDTLSTTKKGKSALKSHSTYDESLLFFL